MGFIDLIVNCDCVEGMKALDADSVDMTITSPPYDGLRRYDGYAFDFDGVVEQLYRVTKPGGVVVWVVGDQTVEGSETATSFKQALGFVAAGFRLHDTMIYHKDNPPPVGGKNRYFQAFEYMFVFSKGAPKTFNPITAPRRNKWNDKRTERTKAFTRDKDGEFVKKRVKLNTGDVKLQNVWTYVVGGGNTSADKSSFRHPATFPEKLVRDHVLSWSNPGDVVLDPFMGSGTTAKVAASLGRRYIGFEISEDYCEIARERLAAAERGSA